MLSCSRRRCFSWGRRRGCRDVVPAAAAAVRHVLAPRPELVVASAAARVPVAAVPFSAFCCFGVGLEPLQHEGGAREGGRYGG